MTMHAKRPVAIKLRETRPSLDDRPMEKRVGLIVLATDHTTEPDFRRMVASERIAVYAARIPYANPTTPENLRNMQPSLTAGAGLVLPGESLDVLCYSCTSASVVIGDEEIQKALQTAKPGVPVVTPTIAASKALRAVGGRRISVLTPYTVATSQPMAEYFTRQGFVIDRFTCLGFDDDRQMARIRPDGLVEMASDVTDPDSDALFISCTALRAAGAVARIEQAIGRPVVSSNLATAWMCRRLCGDVDPRPEWGELMQKALPSA